VPALVLPRCESDVIVLAAGLEQMRVITDELRADVLAPERFRQRLLPDLDRAPRLPEEVSCAADEIVPRRHARQGAGVVVRELHRLLREAIEVRCVELVRIERPTIE